MDFKKVSQIVWMILAALFIVVLFLQVYSGANQIFRWSDSSPYVFIKHNKITGRAYIFSAYQGEGEWETTKPKPKTTKPKPKTGHWEPYIEK